MSINKRLPAGTGDQDSMVPIPHKVSLTDFKEFHRWQRHLLVVSFGNIDPAPLNMGLAREESPVEVVVPALAPSNLVKGDGL